MARKRIEHASSVVTEAGSAPPADQSRDPVTGRWYHHCTAHGCPLAGTVSPSVGAGGPWYCSVHWALQEHPLQAVTALIRANGTLYQQYRAACLTGDSMGGGMALRAFIRACTPRAARQPGEDDE